MIVVQLSINKLRTNGGTQQRIKTDQAVAEDYARHLKAGCKFPPVIVYRDRAGNCWLVSGFHRLLAHKIAGRKTIEVDLREGELREAILFSVGCNAQHGLRRTTEDLRKAVFTLLLDDEWREWANREIARQCGVDEGTVRKYRRLLSADRPQMRKPIADDPQSPGVRVERKDGTRYTYPPRTPRKRAEDMTPDEQAAAVNEAELLALRPRAAATAVQHLASAIEAIGPYEDLADIRASIAAVIGRLQPARDAA